MAGDSCSPAVLLFLCWQVKPYLCRPALWRLKLISDGVKVYFERAELAESVPLVPVCFRKQLWNRLVKWGGVTPLWVRLILLKGPSLSFSHIPVQHWNKEVLFCICYTFEQLFIRQMLAVRFFFSAVHKCENVEVQAQQKPQWKTLAH